MKRYTFLTDAVKWNDNAYEVVERIKSIKYKCLICGSTFDWDDSFDDEKKEHIKSEVDKHHNEHIIQYE